MPPALETKWCHYLKPGVSCREGAAPGDEPICKPDPSCAWFEPDAMVAVIFSDRLQATKMVTLRSLCSFSALSVLIIAEAFTSETVIPERYRNCRSVAQLQTDALANLRESGYRPEGMCGEMERWERSQWQEEGDNHTMIQPLGWDRDAKHASCSNHLRFYLPEFPILKPMKRILFVDDDVVIQRDPKLLFDADLRPGMLLTANCEVNTWNGTCERFDSARSKYDHFFDSVEPEGIEALKTISKHAGLPGFRKEHMEWNFGFNMFDLEGHRKLQMSRRYEMLARLAIEGKLLRGDSLLFGLGVPFLAYIGRIQCYEPGFASGWRVLDGLGYVPPSELYTAGITDETIHGAAVVHFNGEKKIWEGTRFAKYVNAMVKGLLPPALEMTEEEKTPKPLKLVVLLSGPRTGTEWFQKVMTEDPLFCGSIEDRSQPHPEALLPYEVGCKNKSIPMAQCKKWAIIDPQAKLGACTLRSTCDWRVVISSTRAPAHRSTMSFHQREWQRWGETKTATEIFEGYLRRLLRRETDAPELPCACEARSEYLMLKVFLDWLVERPNVYLPASHSYLTRLTGLVGNGHNFNRVDALGVIKRLDGKVLCLLRNPLAQYVSLRTSELVDDWHCFGTKEECAAQKSARRAMEIDPKAAAEFVADGWKMERIAIKWNPIWSRRFEEVMINPEFHLGEVYKALGVRPRTTPILAPHVQTLDPYAMISNAAEVRAAINRKEQREAVAVAHAAKSGR